MAKVDEMDNLELAEKSASFMNFEYKVSGEGVLRDMRTQNDAENGKPHFWVEWAPAIDANHAIQFAETVRRRALNGAWWSFDSDRSAATEYENAEPASAFSYWRTADSVLNRYAAKGPFAEALTKAILKAILPGE